MTQSFADRPDQNKPMSTIPSNVIDQAIDRNRKTTVNYLEIMMKKFEARVINNDLEVIHLETSPDEEDAHLFYIDIHTRAAFFAFCAGYNLGNIENN